MLNKQTTLYFYRGATSAIEFDFTHFDFPEDSKCVFTISNLCGKTKLFQYEFTTDDTYTVVVPDEFTATLKDNQYKYNIMLIVGDERFPQCADSDIIVRDTVNSYE